MLLKTSQRNYLQSWRFSFCPLLYRLTNRLRLLFRAVAAGGVVIELIKDGFKGTEGPIGYSDGSLLFTETQANRIVRIAPDNTVSTFLENSNGATAWLKCNGEIIAVQTLKPRSGIVYPFDKQKTLLKISTEHLFNGQRCSAG